MKFRIWNHKNKVLDIFFTGKDLADINIFDLKKMLDYIESVEYRF